MPTYDRTANTRRGLGNPYLVEQTIDYTEQVTIQNDIVEAIDVPAKTKVIDIFWEVLVVEGAARNFAIGDGATTDGYITTTNGNALATGSLALALTEAAPNTVTDYTNGKYYSAADTIDILTVTAGGLTTMKLKVAALMVTYD